MVRSKTIWPVKFRKASDLEAPVIAKAGEGSDPLPKLGTRVENLSKEPLKSKTEIFSKVQLTITIKTRF